MIILLFIVILHGMRNPSLLKTSNLTFPDSSNVHIKASSPCLAKTRLCRQSHNRLRQRCRTYCIYRVPSTARSFAGLHPLSHRCSASPLCSEFLLSVFFFSRLRRHKTVTTTPDVTANTLPPSSLAFVMAVNSCTAIGFTPLCGGRRSLSG